MNTNPFAELARVAERGHAEREPLPGEPGPQFFTETGTRTAQLMQLLARCGRLTTAEMVLATGLESKLVWGLLKARRAAGQVAHDGDAWELVPGWQPPEVKRAVELLRSRGWTVVAPGERS